MPPSEPTRHEPCPLGVAAMPTIGALSESAPIVAEGIDCAAIFADDACRGCVRLGRGLPLRRRGRGLALPALADVTAVTTAVSVTNEIAVYAISLDACRLCPTINFPLALVGRCSDRQDRHVGGGG